MVYNLPSAEPMIDGVVITPLRQICDERGKVMKMLSRDDGIFSGFGEIYFSCIHPDVIKGWNLHQRMTLNYAVPFGQIKLVLFDDRRGSGTKGRIMELVLGNEHYKLVTIPPGIWYAFKGLGGETAIVANCATLPHDPLEIEKRSLSDSSMPYNWSSP